MIVETKKKNNEMKISEFTDLNVTIECHHHWWGNFPEKKGSKDFFSENKKEKE